MPAKKRTRLVVDVNVLVSHLIGGNVKLIRGIFNKQRFRIVVSEDFVLEYNNVVMRSRMRKYFTEATAERAVHLLASRTERIGHVPVPKPVCRDTKDDYLLALAQAGKAALLITRDEDLLVLKRYGRTRILTPSEFAAEFL